MAATMQGCWHTGGPFREKPALPGNEVKDDPHDTLFASERRDQDLRWKINIPSGERPAVIQALDEHNLNAFSLFDSEQALMQTMWFWEGERLETY